MPRGATASETERRFADPHLKLLKFTLRKERWNRPMEGRPIFSLSGGAPPIYKAMPDNGVTIDDVDIQEIGTDTAHPALNSVQIAPIDGAP
jgi:hypothetical protein